MAHRMPAHDCLSMFHALPSLPLPSLPLPAQPPGDPGKRDVSNGAGRSIHREWHLLILEWTSLPSRASLDNIMSRRGSWVTTKITLAASRHLARHPPKPLLLHLWLLFYLVWILKCFIVVAKIPDRAMYPVNYKGDSTSEIGS